MVAGVPALIAGNGFTIMPTVSVFVQPLVALPVTVYIVVVPGVAVGLMQVVQDKPAAGDHE